MQSKSIAHLEQLKPHILCDDTDEVWAKVDGLMGARVDFVLDNAGYQTILPSIDIPEHVVALDTEIFFWQIICSGQF